MTLQKVLKPGGMTLQNFGQALVLVAASACKCRGGMTLQKSAFRWRHEAANWHALTAERARPDPVYLHTELRRAGVTLELLHLEYLEQHPEGLRYTAFCDAYRRWRAKAAVTMRQVHRAGEKCFVDYSGTLARHIDPQTGEVVEVELFVAVLGASNYTYAEATRTQQIADWIGAHVRCFDFLGGVPRDVVPDQLKSGVTGACRYEPKIQRTYEELARHYETTVLPARPAHPKDKAKVERAGSSRGSVTEPSSRSAS
jgi:transposase